MAEKGAGRAQWQECGHRGWEEAVAVRRQLIGECANRGRGLRPRWTGLDSLEKVTGNTKEGCANLLEMTEGAGPSLLEPGHREPGPDVEPGVGPSGAEELEHKKGLSSSRSLRVLGSSL